MTYDIKVWDDGNPTFNRQPRTDAVRYICVHYTADGKPDSHTSYNSMLYFSRANRDASAHFFIDDHDIYEYADPARWSCWHVGDGHGTYGITNQNSVGIEVVQDDDAPFSDEEVRKLTWLVGRLMNKFGVAPDHVVRHYDASRKACPLYYTPEGSGGDMAWRRLHQTITNGGSMGKKVDLGDVAAKIHYDMVTDPRNGYSQGSRWGGQTGQTKTLTINGRKYTYALGDRDCASSVIEAWRLALKGTKYEGALDDATYTGDMLEVFVNSGLFTSSLTPAKRGDLYLTPKSAGRIGHTAMCQDGGSDGVFGRDCLSEFLRDENHAASGGQVGDQDGGESVFRDYYNFPWVTVIHYNNKADYYVEDSEQDVKPTPSKQKVKATTRGVYRVYDAGNSRHHWTSDATEAQKLVDSGWTYEGVAWKSSAKGAKVYRAYNPKTGDHLLCTDAARMLTALGKGWRYEGVSFLAGGSKPVYELYDGPHKEHFYTTDPDERKACLAWMTDKGVAFKV